MSPKVSICIPAFASPSVFRKVLDSVQMQTFGDYELVITDDSPGIELETLLKEFDFGGRLRYVRNKIQLGSPANWNYAADLAKGEYIKMLHSDDFFTTPESLAKYVKLLDDQPAARLGFSATEVWNVATNNRSLHSCSPKDLARLQNEPELLFFRNVIGAPSATIYRRSIGDGYDIRFKWLVDVDFYIGMVAQYRPIAYSSEPLVRTSHHSGSQVTQQVIADKNLQIKEHIMLLEKLLAFNPQLHEKKFALFFKLLFYKFGVKNLNELNSIIPIPPGRERFFEKIVSSVNDGMFFTRALMRFYNSSLNRKILKMEIF